MPHMIPAPGAFAAGVAIFLIVIWDAFEAIILPRRVTRRFRLTRLFYKTTWTTWKFIIGLVSSRKGRETLLGFFGPISLLILVRLEEHTSELQSLTNLVCRLLLQEKK